MSQRLSIPASEFCHFGDEKNDHGAFEWAGWSLCPSNGTVDTKARAKEVSGLSNEQDFIAEALSRWDQLAATVSKL
jgi:hydroxymethylpyrimidine pyrophosphatase-like HAD family hydrolase|eukprot:COSAG01_NODE_9772_length_2349_cov_0.976000_3_plen_76_part_00